MTLTDSGAIIALIDEDDPAHKRCTAALSGLDLPLITTCHCLTESMYMVGRALGYEGQQELWDNIADGVLTVVELEEAQQGRMRAFMTQYRDRPCDLADASLLANAEATGTTRIFSIDSDFLFYTLPGGRVLQVIPGPRR